MSTAPYDHILRHAVDERRRGWVYLLGLLLAVVIIVLAIATAL